ncbi:MAG: glycosyltransferase [Thermincolia bacterium]
MIGMQKNGEQPLVSIGMPVYNGEPYLRQALDSLVAQDYMNFELIISDNASTDRTYEICQEYRVGDNRIKLYRNETNLGSSWNGNRVFDLALGKYFMWAAHDDFWDRTYISKCVAKLEKHPEAVLCHTEINFINEVGECIDFYYNKMEVQGMDIPDRIQVLISKINWYTIYGLIRTQVLKKIQMRIDMYGSDVVLLLQLLLLGEFVKVYEPLFNYRVLVKNKSALEYMQDLNPEKISQVSKAPYSGLARDLLKYVMISDLDYSIKRRIENDFVETLSLYNMGWLYTLLNENQHKLHVGSSLEEVRTFVAGVLFKTSGLSVTWEPSLYDTSGTAAFFQNALTVLKEKGVNVTKADITAGVHISYGLPFIQCRKKDSGHKAYIGGAIFGADRIHASWVEVCNTMDEIWVPSVFNFETFTQSGVDPAKIQVIPFGIAAERFNPEETEPLFIEGRKGFNFLSTFQWTKRKGWDILLRAYLETFDPSEDVSLTIMAYYGKGESVGERVANYITTLGYDLDKIPEIIILDERISDELMAALYAAAEAYVLPSRGEGWGSSYLEAMTMGLPTIGTKWSGNLEFMNEDNSYLVDINGLVDVDQEQVDEDPFYAGHRWADPSLEHLKQVMRFVYQNREEAAEKGKKARQDVLNHWTIDYATEKMIKRLKKLTRK